MAVLNVAYALVAKGRNVLVLDMDLEAPGLSGFLRRHREIGDFARQDMVDLVRWAADFSIASQQASEPLDAASFPPLTDFIVSVPREKLEPLPHPYAELGRLDIVPVDEERDYYGRLTALAMGEFRAGRFGTRGQHPARLVEEPPVCGRSPRLLRTQRRSDGGL